MTAPTIDVMPGAVASPPPAPSADAQPTGWAGPLFPLDQVTGDRRIIATPASNTLRVRPLPLPLKYQRASAEGHDDAVVVGNIDRVWVQDGMVWGSGPFDLNDETSLAVARRMRDGFAGWVSADLDDTTEAYLCGDEKCDPFVDDIPTDVKVTCVASDWRLMGATLVADPAFPTAKLHATYADQPDADTTAEQAAEMAVRSAGYAAIDTAACTACDEDDTEGLAVVGDTSLPWFDRETPWDGDAATGRMFDAATSNAGTVDESMVARGFLWRDDTADPQTRAAYSLPFADVDADGTWKANFLGLSGSAAAINGARGGVDIPADAQDAIAGKVNALYRSAADAFDDPSIIPDDAMTVTASGEPANTPYTVTLFPKAAWFAMPEPDEPTPVTITADGQIFGHLGDRDIKHLSREIPVPVSRSGYAYFNLGAVLCDDGTEVAVGTIFCGTPHAADGPDVRPAQVFAHYADTGTAVAAVHCTQGRHGPWMCGALVAEASPEAVATLRRSPPSGDWRTIGGSLELVAVLAVNMPAFPVRRVRTGAGGRVLSLVGHFGPRPAQVVVERRGLASFTAAERAELAQEIMQLTVAANRRAAAAKATRDRVALIRAARITDRVATLKKGST